MIVGLTGGIGSGKSTVAFMFEILGCAVFNSDTVAKQVYFVKDVKKEVTDLLGPDAYKNDRELNKAYISSKIFTNTNLLHQLNAIIHPRVKHKFEEFVKQNSQKIIIKETALLFEAKLDRLVDKKILVAADDELRIKRVMKRDGLSREEVLNKIKSQMAQEEKMKLSDMVIYNNEKEFVITQVLGIYNKLSKNA